jgi:hypothetical protein
MRHKQSAPKRRQQAAWTDNEAATASHDSDDDAGQEQRQQQHTLAGLPRPPQLIQEYSYAAASELTVSTETNVTPVGAIAEFVCATKAAGTPSADAAPATVLVQLFQKDYDRIWQSAPHPVLLFSWRCPGEDEYGPMHEVGALLQAYGQERVQPLGQDATDMTSSRAAVSTALSSGRCFELHQL